ncbi:MAG: sel1 repeat family protein [Deltaproteobacteria bacterium]|jgi:TPR repeat protein|nr:sel1 repeat family protein [Deltaproteobacteria bacterium]
MEDTENKDLSEIDEKAESGDPGAQYALAFRTLNEGDSRKSREKAFDLALKSANQGLREAQSLVGSLYFRGVGVRQDFPEAVRWYLSAALQGDRESSFNLGLMYHSGLGVLKNRKMALEWLEKSLSRGKSKGFLNLLTVFENDQGVEISLPEARKRLLSDAGDGDPVAQHDLGVMCLLGQGGPEDPTEAEFWFRKAADQGHRDSELNLLHLALRKKTEARPEKTE